MEYRQERLMNPLRRKPAPKPQKLLRAALTLLLCALFLLAPALGRAAEVQLGWADGFENLKEYTAYSTSDQNTAWLEQGQLMFENKEEGQSIVSLPISLAPETCYRITATLSLEAEADGQFFMDFDNQMATSDPFTQNSGQLELYVMTNVDPHQDYLLLLCLESSGRASASISALTVEPLAEVPWNAQVNTLLGLTEEEWAEQQQGPSSDVLHMEKSEIQGEQWGLGELSITLLIALFVLAIYLVCSGKLKILWERQQKKALFLLLAAIALALRVYLSLTSQGHLSDLECFKAWSLNAYSVGFAEFYNGSFFVDYPPLYMYVLYLIGWLQSVFAIPYGEAGFTLLIELPAILCDMAIAYFLYRVCRRQKKTYLGVCLGLLMLFNPMSLMDSAVWGQIDSVFALMILAMLWALERDRTVLGALLWVAAILLKPQGIFFLPVLGIKVLWDFFVGKRYKKTLLQVGASLIGGTLLYLVICAPFLPGKSVLFFVEQFFSTVSGYQYATVNAFNCYGMFGLNYVPDTEGGLLSYRAIGFIMIAVICCIAVVLGLKSKKQGKYLALGAFVQIGIFLFGHNIHERYLYTGVILLFAALVYLREKRLLYGAAGLSILCFLNMQMALVYTVELMPDYIMIPGSILTVAAGLYTLYLLGKLLLGDQEKVRPGRLLENNVKRKEIQTMKSNRREKRKLDAQMRLEAEMTRGKLLHKKDALLMILITVLYAIVAFVNLGSFTIPSTQEEVQQRQTYTIQLTQEEYVSYVSYYAGYGEADITVSVSEDGEDFQNVAVNPDPEEGESEYQVAQRFKDMYKWKLLPIDQQARYIRLTFSNSDILMNEFGVIGDERNVLEIQSVVDEEGNVVPSLFDEQQEVAPSTTYMKNMYFDEIYHARTAYEYIHNIYPYEITHPPLGKSFIALGIDIFGMNPFGWRCMGTLAGVLMLPVMYVLLKMLLKKTKYAVIGTVLLAVDFMHFAQTRIATIDSYSVLFIMLMYLFMFWYTRTNFNKQPLIKTLVPLFWCGLFFGLGAATKWLCLYAGAGLAVIFFYQLYLRHQEIKYLREVNPDAPEVKRYRKNVVYTLLFCVGVFILIPLVIYIVSYLPYFAADDANFTFQGILDNQKYMLNYHGNLEPDHPHPFASRWYTWPLDIRPVYFFMGENMPAGQIASLSTFGNPLVWWGGLVGVIYLIVQRIRKKQLGKHIGFVVVALLSQYLPWVLISRETFIYHYFASVPFLIILLVYALKYLWENTRHGKKIAIGYVVLCGVIFAMFYPVITGIPVDIGYAQGVLRWLQSWPFY